MVWGVGYSLSELGWIGLDRKGMTRPVMRMIPLEKGFVESFSKKRLARSLD